MLPLLSKSYTKDRAVPRPLPILFNRLLNEKDEPWGGDCERVMLAGKLTEGFPCMDTAKSWAIMRFKVKETMELKQFREILTS